MHLCASTTLFSDIIIDDLIWSFIIYTVICTQYYLFVMSPRLRLLEMILISSKPARELHHFYFHGIHTSPSFIYFSFYFNPKAFRK